ncbi:MAG: TonB-dependent receptor [Flavobacteriales bacterium]
MRQLLHRSFLFCSLLWAMGAHAQSIVVVDATDGEPIPFAQVVVLRADSIPVAARMADAAGRLQLDASVPHMSGDRFRVVAMGFMTDTVARDLGRTRIALQRSRQELGAAVVTGQYGPTLADQAVHKVRVIDQERLERLAANDLSDALRNELNIRLSQDNILGTSMSMQGLGGENVKILIDGVPVIGRQNGNVDLAQLDLNGIARVEVVEGPLSVNYGTNALAGTINLITKRSASAAPELKLTAYAEQIGRLQVWGAGSKRWGRHNVNLNLGRDFFNGWNPGQKGIPDLSPSVADTTRFQQWKPREQYTARLNYRWNGPRWQLGYKAEAGSDVITNRGLPRAPYYESAFDERYHTVRWDNAVFADRYWAGGRKVTVLAAHDRYARTRNTWARDLTDLGEELVVTDGMQDTSRFSLTNVRAVYANTADSARLRYEFGTDLNLETGSGDRIDEGRGSTIGDYALYTSVEYRPVRALVLRPGVRYAYNTVYGAPLVPSLNVRWQLDTAFTIRTGFASGFRAPSLKELYFYFVDVNHDIQGNEDLNAERSNNYSASLVWNKAVRAGAWRAEVGGFHNVIKDLITLAQVGSTLYSYVNIGDYRTSGGSIGAAWEGKRWSFSIGGSLTGRYDDLARERAEPYLWSHEARASMDHTWKKHGISAQLFYKYQGELANYVVLDDGAVGRSTLQAFHMADASVTKTFRNGRIGITAGSKNLFDVQNLTAAAGSTVGVHSGNGTSVPMMTGRVWFLRLNMEIKGKER